MSNLATQPVKEKCRLCLAHLDPDEDDDVTNRLCSSCKGRPEARHLGLGIPPPPSPPRLGLVSNKPPSKSARELTPADKGLIRKVHGYMPAPQLLAILNERLACDLGPDAMPYTMEQLHAEIGDVVGAAPTGGHDWASLRKLLAQAKRSGVLDAITEQVINDFAVVFSLNSKQVLGLKDIVLQSEEDGI